MPTKSPKEELRTELEHSTLSDSVKAIIKAAITSAGTSLHSPGGQDEPLGAVHLRWIEVQGFRGIGQKRRLELPAGPGLTLVIGRNGSGKSSFAEGLEALLTEKLERDGRNSQPKLEHWQNLGWTGDVVVAAGFDVEGTGEVIFKREWKAGTRLEEGKLVEGTLESFDWYYSLSNHSPLLSHVEVGRLSELRPCDLFDRFEKLLGMEDWQVILEPIDKKAKELATQSKHCDDKRKALIKELERMQGDSRADLALQAIDKSRYTQWDLAALAALEHTPVDGEAGQLVRALSAQLPEAETVIACADALDAVALELETHRNSDAGMLTELTRLLEQALAFRQKTGDDNCPVCGAKGRTGSAWEERTRLQLEAQREGSKSIGELERRKNRLLADARVLHVKPPIFDLDAVLAAAQLGQDELLARWERWSQALDSKEPIAVAKAIRNTLCPLLADLETAYAQGHAVLKSLDQDWRALAARLETWRQDAVLHAARKDSHQAHETARKWLDEQVDAVRNRRFDAIADQVLATWGTLRQGSAVDVQTLLLTGRSKSKTRSLDFTVEVDGNTVDAMDPLSQGELNSLSLSLFIPRALSKDSPFNFVVIDDPVQAMDPHKVDGLAQVLEETAKTHRVLVFTHDPRLWDSVRRISNNAVCMTITRAEDSKVDVEVTSAPTDRHLQDADLVWEQRDSLGLETAAKLTRHLCKLSLEAHLTDHFRHTHLGSGDPHAQVEEKLRRAKGLRPLASLALFDNHRDGERVEDSLSKQYGGTYADTFSELARASHDNAEEVGAEELIKLTRKLIKQLRTKPLEVAP